MCFSHLLRTPAMKKIMNKEKEVSDTEDKVETTVSIEPAFALTYKLSPHFPVSDMVRSQLATRNDIDQLKFLTPNIIERAELLATNVAEKIRERFGPFSPNSWFRCEEVEKILCDRAYKKWCKARELEVTEETWRQYFLRKSHPTGTAMDLEFAGVDNKELFEWCKENLEFDQLILEFYKEGVANSGWVHISYSASGNRNQAFTIG